MANDKGVRVVNCPFGDEFCYPSCYWHKGNGRIIKLKKERGELQSTQALVRQLLKL